MKRYCIITIEREYASGGSLVGKLVGHALGIPVYGREILEKMCIRDRPGTGFSRPRPPAQ